MPETLSFCVPAEADGERLDKWLSGQESLAMTRSALQVRMEHGDVTVNGKKVPKNYRQKAGDQVLVQLPEPEPLELQPENIPLDIVYEDDDLLVVNKPKHGCTSGSRTRDRNAGTCTIVSLRRSAFQHQWYNSPRNRAPYRSFYKRLANGGKK